LWHALHSFRLVSALEQQLDQYPSDQPAVALSLTEGLFSRSFNRARWQLSVPLPPECAMMIPRERGGCVERETRMTEQDEPTRKLSRQQLRAQARMTHDAEGWIAVLDIEDLALQRVIREAIGPRRVTRAALETAIGVSLVGTPRTIRGMRKS
jgi:hypothetical protein